MVWFGHDLFNLGVFTIMDSGPNKVWGFCCRNHLLLPIHMFTNTICIRFKTVFIKKTLNVTSKPVANQFLVGLGLAWVMDLLYAPAIPQRKMALWPF